MMRTPNIGILLIVGLMLIGCTSPAQDNQKVLAEPYSIKHEQVYFYTDIIVGADAATFEVLSPDYARDKSSVFYAGVALDDVDVETANVDDLGLILKDKNKVLYNGTVIQSADPNTFEVLNDVYSKDNEHVYFTWYEIHDFQSYGDYVFDYSIQGADAASFEVLGQGEYLYAKDNNHTYYEGKVVEDR